MIRDFMNTEDEPIRPVDLPDAPAEETAKRVEMPAYSLSAVDALPVGMVYAPMQRYTDLYAPEQALCRGTLFQALDLPFREGRNK